MAVDLADALASRRRRQLWITVPALVLYFAVAVGRYFVSGADWMTAVGVLAVVGVGLLASFIIWRCPACGKYLGEELYPTECPRCGVSFSKSEDSPERLR